MSELYNNVYLNTEHVDHKYFVLAVYQIYDILSYFSLRIGSITMSTKYLWKRKSSVSSGWNDVIIMFPCRTATTSFGSFAKKIKYKMYVNNGLRMTLSMTFNTLITVTEYWWNFCNIDSQVNLSSHEKLKRHYDVLWPIPFRVAEFRVESERKGNVARTFTLSLLSIEAIPGARMKIPWKVSSSSLPSSYLEFYNLKIHHKKHFYECKE